MVKQGQGLLKAVRYFGSQRALAEKLHVKQQAVSNWLNRDKKIPYEYVIQIVWATEGYVTYHELAPQQPTTNQILDEIIKNRGHILPTKNKYAVVKPKSKNFQTLLLP